MTTDDALLFIDANIYLALYETRTGKRLLAPLSEQCDRIFVTQQVVDEVQRRKLAVAADFLKKSFPALPSLGLQICDVPDHLFGTTQEESDKISGTMKQIRKDVKEINQALKQLNQDIDALAAGIMAKISQSTDEVSTALGPIFAKAEPHRDEELRRARNRKELGNPPGKQEKPLGDQITWEQILSRFASKQTLQKLWIITRDPDYGPVYGDRGFLNQFLYQELRAVSSRAEAFLFKDIVDGIKDFARTTGVEAIELPTGEEAAEIKKEIEALPPVGGHSLSPSAASLSLSGATPITGGQYLFTGGPQGIPLTLLSELLARKEEY